MNWALPLLRVFVLWHGLLTRIHTSALLLQLNLLLLSRQEVPRVIVQVCAYVRYV